MTYFTKEFEKNKGFSTDEIVVEKVEINKIVPDSHQVRETFDDEKLKELSYSIKEKGILNPIHVRKDAENNRYIILTGERRFRAAQMVNLTVVPCIIHEDSLSETEIKALQLIENIQRQDLTALETARGFEALLTQGLGVGDISRSLGISESTIKKARIVIKKLPQNWMKEVEKKSEKISIEQLYNIAKEQNKKKQVGLYKKLMESRGHQVELEEPTQEQEQKEKKKKRDSEYTDEEWETIWENIKKVAKTDKAKLADYIPPKRLQTLLEYGRDNKEA